MDQWLQQERLTRFSNRSMFSPILFTRCCRFSASLRWPNTFSRTASASAYLLGRSTFGQ